MSVSREIKETRTFGGTLLVVNKRGDEVLMIPDESKTEVSAGVSSVHGWQPGGRKVFALPAGGRGTNDKGLPETLRQNLQAELREEIENAYVRLPHMDASRLRMRKQEYPLAVAQLKSSERINYFAAQSLYVPINYFSRESQKIIYNRVGEGFAAWQNVAKLMKKFKLIESNPDTLKDFRPQTLAIAALYHMSVLEAIDPSQISDMIKSWNEELYRFIVIQAKILNLPIKNGAYNKSGEIALEKLNARDRDYLFGTI